MSGPDQGTEDRPGGDGSLAEAGISIRPVGEGAVLLEAPGWPPVALAAAVREAAVRPLPGRALPPVRGLQDVVPGAATVLVVVAGGEEIAALLSVIAGIPDRQPPSPSDPGEEETVEIPVVYDGADLDEVARHCGLTVAEVVAAHQGAVYQAAFCGFAPGFAYLSGLPERLWVPRRRSPRPAVPAGSVAVADRYSAVYPAPSPGGWQLLGRTDVAVWDIRRQPPALLSPGTHVRFVAAERSRRPAATATRSSSPEEPPAAGALHVLDPGVLTTVQDPGRPGLGHQGVPPSGWLDGPAARLANRLVGNDDGAALLEATIGGPRLRLDLPPGASRAVAVTGAEVSLSVDGRPAATNAPLEVNGGSRIEVGWAREGARAYLAVAGGLDVPPVLASRATDLLSGIGPPRLAAGQSLALGPDGGRRSGLDVAPIRRPHPQPLLRVLPGPRDDWFGPDALAVLAATTWTVGSESNRVGLRLSGAVLARSRPGELPPEGLIAGALQVPPSGEPVLFLADHPVTGGYPVLGVVVGADMHLAAQLRPGASLRFALVRSARAADSQSGAEAG
ncbi:urea amidolyase family protein [Acidiferrimicrobium sp. IK]|uniref:5-oxoprolinase subunit B/C family protein n=1 Tax=Acidiferrimicrobium sp. IK TaxID=2871700 RepID=UPI0021CAFF8F|nr:urea amidolyase family protein [Acidiferrimicrobium sp. IK]MCU4184278.1 urea amidolyase family protein [Acidiferrimicrobium sp. IK]